jgi:hypothetical protein
MRYIFAPLLAFSFALPALAADPPPLKLVWEVTEGLDRPESAYYDAESKSLFLSVISGPGDKKDGVGWIAQLDKSGKVIKAKWAEGLNAPKGLRSHGGTLWVSDLDQVVGFDIATGKEKARIAIEGAKFLNDLATGPDGTVYVNDMHASKIYAIKDGKASLFAEGDDLEHPNGILVEGDSLIMCGWGTIGNVEPKTLGRLYKLDLKSKKKTLITKEPTGNLDGVESDGHGGYIVTDWVAGKVMRIGGDGKVTLLLKHDKNGTADHAYFPKERLLVLPLMLDNKVQALELPE